MRSLRVPLVIMLLCCPAAAQDSRQNALSTGAPETQDPQQFDIGRGVVCDSPQQLVRFVALRDNGQEAPTALQTVNDEARNASACSMVMVMFTGRKSLGELTIHGKIVAVVEINAQAFGDGTVWKRVPAVRQYTLVHQNGQNV
jgi:hypothetical protein